MTPRPPALLVGLGACTISFAAVLVKLLHVPPTAVGFYRMAIAAVALLALALWSQGRAALAGSGRALALAVLSGACFAGDLFVWHQSILKVGAGVATLLANTQVFWVLTLSHRLLGERVPARLGLNVLMALVGVSLVAGVWGGQALAWDGVAWGLGTGIFYAGYYISLRHSQLQPRPLSQRMNLAVSAATCAVLLYVLALLHGEEVPVPSPPDAAWLLLLGLGVHVGGWLLIQSGMARIKAAQGSVLLLLQPTLACVWGALFFGEPLDVPRVAGVALTLVAIARASRG